MFLDPANNKTNGKVLSLDGQLLPVLSAADLLATSRRQVWWAEILRLLAQPEEHFQAMVQDLLANFAEFMQVIPSEQNDNFESLLDLGLYRAYTILEVMREQETNNKTTDPLLLYATFSAGLLAEIREVLAHKKIMLCDTAGSFLTEWSPFTGPILRQAEFYKIRPYYLPLQQISLAVNPVLARQLLPIPAFLWLAGDLEILNQWIAALAGDDDRSGQIGHWLGIAKKRIAPQLSLRLDMFPVRIQDAPDTEQGEKFFKWLEDNLDQLIRQGKGIKVIDEGVLLAFPLLFREYTQTIPGADPDMVFQQFKRLGIVAEDIKFNLKQADLSKAETIKAEQINAGQQQNASENKQPVQFFLQDKSKTRFAKQKAASVTLDPEVEKALWVYVAKQWLVHETWKKIVKKTSGHVIKENKFTRQLDKLIELSAKTDLKNSAVVRK